MPHPFTFLTRHKAVFCLLPSYLGAAVGLAGLISINTRDSIATQLASVWSIPTISLLALVFVTFCAAAMRTHGPLHSSIVLPRWFQRSLFFSGLGLATALMVSSAITLSVYHDTTNFRVPNRTLAWVSVKTQHALFGEFAALDWIWVLQNNAKKCNDSQTAKYWKDQAENLCLSIPSFNYKRIDRPNGDIVHDFANTPLGSLKESNFVHEDDSVITFGDGFVDFPIGFGNCHRIDLNEKIRHINIVEKLHGEKEYRFNGAAEPQIIYTPWLNLVYVHPSVGMTMFESDIPFETNLISGASAERFQIAFDSQNMAGSIKHKITLRQSEFEVNLPERAVRMRVIGTVKEPTSMTLWNDAGDVIKEIAIPKHSSH